MTGRTVWCVEQIVWEPSIVTDETEMCFNKLAEYFQEWEYFDSSLDKAFAEVRLYLTTMSDANFNKTVTFQKVLYIQQQENKTVGDKSIEDYTLYEDETGNRTVGDVLLSAISKFVFACYDLSTSNDEGYANRTVWHIDNKEDAKGYQGFVETSYKKTPQLNMSKFVSKKKRQ